MLMRLTAIQLSGIFKSMFRMKGNASKKRSPAMKLLIGVLAVYIIISMFSAFGMMFAQLAESLVPLGLGWIYFAYAGIMIVLMCFIGSVFATGSQIYDAKDNDLLFSMPIKPQNILLSRILSLMALNYMYTFLIALPAGAVYVYYNGGVSALNVVFFIGGTLMLPLIAMTLSCIVGWLVGLISSRMSRKNLVSTIFMIIFFVAYMLFFTNFQNYMNALIQNGENIGRTLSKYLPPLYSYGASIAGGSVAQFALLAVYCLVPFTIVYLILSKSFVKIATSKKGAIKKEYVEKEMSVASAGTALLKKEWRRFVSLPTYILNCSLGAVFEVVVAVYLLIKPDMLDELFMTLPEYMSLLPLFICILLSACAVMNNICAPSISLEGKNIQLLQSMPIRPITVYNAKILLNILVGIPSIIISGVLCCIVLDVSIIQGVFIFLIPFAAQCFTAVFGLFANILFPRFDWINETSVIKQSVSVLIALFGGIAVIAAPSALVIMLAQSAGLPLGTLMLILFAFFALLSGMFYLYIYTAGQRRFADFA